MECGRCRLQFGVSLKSETLEGKVFAVLARVRSVLYEGRD